MTDLININKFLNNAIGFEDIFNRFSLLHSYNTGFPYYNIKKNAKADQYTLEMSLSGYKKSDINIEVTDGILEITGKAKENTEDYVYKGMAQELLRVSYNYLNTWKQKVLNWKTEFLK